MRKKTHYNFTKPTKSVCLFVYEASVLTILTELRASARFAEHVIDAERYCRWCTTHAHTRFSSRRGIGELYISLYTIVQTLHTYVLLHHIYIIISFIDIRFCQVLYFTLYCRRKKLNAQENCLTKMYLFLLYYRIKQNKKIANVNALRLHDSIVNLNVEHPSLALVLHFKPHSALINL